MISGDVYVGGTCILVFCSLRFSPVLSYSLYKSMPRRSNVLERGDKALLANYPHEVQSESYLRNFGTVQEGFEKV